MHLIRYKISLLLIVIILTACSSGYELQDGKYVYVKVIELGERLSFEVRGADTATFHAFPGTPFAVDKSSAYFETQRIESAQPSSFKALSDTYAADNLKVFWRDKPIHNADPRSLEILSIEWSRDKNDIYLQDRVISTCDRATFQFMKYDWQRDNKCVYHRGQLIPSADSASFTPINDLCGRDKNNIYSSITRKVTIPSSGLC